MIEQVIEWLIVLFILGGALISFLSAIGIVRFPDIYLRSHAATKSTTLGLLFLITGAIIYFSVFNDHFSFRLLFTMIFIFITAPVAGHLIGRAAYKTGVPVWRGSVDKTKRGKKNVRSM